MKYYIEDRVIELANYIIDNNATVRSAAKEFHISKSTVHKDVTSRLPLLNRELYKKVLDILKTNKEQRHIRGGIATKEKYRKLRLDT